jgi:2,5-diketo-D-gluconate reductase B
MASEPMVAGIPQMGYGTWNRPGDEARQGVVWALEAGCRHIDTAQGYENEADVAQGIADSGVARGDIFLTTKVRQDNFGPGQLVPSVRESLDKLKTDAVDLLLLHWPSTGEKIPLETYVSQLAEAYDAGMAKRIGVSNFTKSLVDRTQDLLGDRKIAVNQVEAHVYMQNRPIVRHCQAKDIAITAYSPLARGKVIGDPVLDAIAAAHGVKGEQVALAFLMAKGMIVIPSSGKRDRIISNFEARTIVLSAEEVGRIEALDRGMRVVNGAWCPTWDVE